MYYLFSGLDQPKDDVTDGTMVEAIVEFKEGSYLYAGVLDGYELNEHGQLDRLTLIWAQRRKFECDREYHETRSYPIEGDVFVLRYDDVKTLNITYLSLDRKRHSGMQAPARAERSPRAIEHRCLQGRLP